MASVSVFMKLYDNHNGNADENERSYRYDKQSLGSNIVNIRSVSLG